MELFKFDRNCYVCKCHRNRKAVVHNIFDKNICNSRVSYLSCHSCYKMMKYELEYEKEKFNKYCKEAILFNLICKKLDKQYNSMNTVKEKKTYMKEVIRQCTVF